MSDSVSARSINYSDYLDFFALSVEDQSARILDFLGGFSDFNQRISSSGGNVTSVDPIYSISQERLLEMLRYHHSFGMDNSPNEDSLNERVTEFCNRDRYLPFENLPLPFADYQFDLALVNVTAINEIMGHQLSLLALLKELLRVSKEVRVFPLLDNTHLVAEWGNVMYYLQEHHFGQELKVINRNDEESDRTMLRIWAMACDVAV